MSNMAENGSGKSAWSSPSSESHEEFLELCALATTELLSAQERGRLEDHLRHCASCREMHAQYQTLVGAGIPVASVNPDGEYPVPSTSDWSIEAAEAALFARLDREQVKAGEANRRPELRFRTPQAVRPGWLKDRLIFEMSQTMLCGGKYGGSMLRASFLSLLSATPSTGLGFTKVWR